MRRRSPLLLLPLTRASGGRSDPPCIPGSPKRRHPRPGSLEGPLPAAGLLGCAAGAAGSLRLNRPLGCDAGAAGALRLNDPLGCAAGAAAPPGSPKRRHPRLPSAVGALPRTAGAPPVIRGEVSTGPAALGAIPAG